MERAISTTLRHCFRSGKGTFRCSTGEAKKCIATNICPARKSGLSMSSSTKSSGAVNGGVALVGRGGNTSPNPNGGRRILRGYSTENSQSRVSETRAQSQSSIAGTIGEGQAGLSGEDSRALEALVAPEHLNEKEVEIFELLERGLKPVRLEVQDISGGCGSMYGIEIVSERFRGLGVLKQQRLVNGVLGERIKEWHGVQLKTRAP